jgi:hypothetical protein
MQTSSWASSRTVEVEKIDRRESNDWLRAVTFRKRA